MTPQERAKDVYDKMKGFRVTNKHRKKCTRVAVELIQSDSINPEYWAKVLIEVQNIKV